MKDAMTEAARTVETIGIRELRDGLSRYVAAVRAGTEITVTDHGRPVARIIPIENDLHSELVASGRLVPAEDPSAKLPMRRDVGALSDLIER